MSSGPIAPSNGAYAAIPPIRSRPGSVRSRPNSYAPSGTLAAGAAMDEGHGPVRDSSPFAGSQENHDSSRHDDSRVQDTHGTTGTELRRSSSQLSQSQSLMPSRGGTLKKKASLRKTGSVKRSSSRRGSRAGSVRSLALGEKEKYGEGDEFNSAFRAPIPTTGSPTDVLANRFQAWRKVLKQLINYFRDIQKSYDVRSKTLVTASNAISTITIPPEFLTSGGICEATYILQDFHKHALNDSNKAREIDNEIILQLTGLRSVLQQKIKEIKSLVRDFKNSVDKETEGSRKVVGHLQEALGLVDSDPASVAGKGDPFIVKLAVDRQIEQQIEEENYLHRAYLNLEASGRELESIVVGEIQKAYTAYAAILKREADQAYDAAERLGEGPIGMAKDREWDEFVTKNDHMVDPNIPVRSFQHITYPGKNHPAAAEVRSGMLERKSKYLKNYTPGWYILSPTHLHEFKSADGISSQTPIMSLYLPEQKLGSRSEPGSSSHKFMVKGRQTGGMHRGHSWIFRAESHDTMMAWYSDIKQLAEKSGRERDAYVRRSHARSLSGGSLKAHSIGSSDGGLEEDEADAQPYSSEQSIRGGSAVGTTGMRGAGEAYGAGVPPSEGGARYGGAQLDETRWQSPQRPSPGGRFPSDLKAGQGLRARRSLSSGNSTSEGDRDALAATNTLPGSGTPFAHNQTISQQGQPQSSSLPHQMPPQDSSRNHQYGQPQAVPSQYQADAYNADSQRDYTAPAMAAAAGTGLAAGTGAMYAHKQGAQQEESADMTQPSAVPVSDTSAPPVTTTANMPTNNNNDFAAPAPSSQDNTGSLSTMPTSFGSVQNTAYNNNGSSSNTTTTFPDPSTTNPSTITQQPHELPGQQIGETGTAAAAPPVAAATTQQPTKPGNVRSQTATTISDLHIPGEYPRTPRGVEHAKEV